MNSAFVLMVLLLTDAAFEGASAPPVQLPKPAALDMSLGAALQARRSIRAFSVEKKLSRQQLGTLLWAMCGVNRPDQKHPFGGRRTSPSAYGSCAVDVMVVSEKGTFTYSPKDHALVPDDRLGTEDVRDRVSSSSWTREAPVLMVLVANLGRYPGRVAGARRRDYSHADAAVMGQNLYLACAALELGTVLTVDIKAEAARALRLEEDQEIILVMPVGYPGSR